MLEHLARLLPTAQPSEGSDRRGTEYRQATGSVDKARPDRVHGVDRCLHWCRDGAGVRAGVDDGMSNIDEYAHAANELWGWCLLAILLSSLTWALINWAVVLVTWPRRRRIARVREQLRQEALAEAKKRLMVTPPTTELTWEEQFSAMIEREFRAANPDRG